MKSKKQPQRLSWRLVNYLTFFFCCALLITAWFVQYVIGIEPCVLCIVQRLLIILLMMGFGLAGLHNPQRTGKMVYGAWVIFVSSLGIVVAGRQVWLEQHVSVAESVQCLPGFSYLMEHLPWQRVLWMLFHGDTGCGQVNWHLFGFSLATWTLGIFIFLVCLELGKLIYYKN